MAARPGQCCGVPAAPAAGPAAAGWDANAAWYTSNMSPATSALAWSLYGHLGLLDGTSAAGLRVVETHCGDARAAAGLLSAPAVASYTACDFSQAMLDRVQERLGCRAEAVSADSASLPFEDGSFDRYVSNLGCCCAADLEAKLREAHRVLAPGGRAAMSMRIAGGEGDTAFAPAEAALAGLGLPPGPDREGLRLGRDLPGLRARLEGVGFRSAVAWRTWVTLPIHDEESFRDFAASQPPIRKFLAELPGDKRDEAARAVRDAGRRALEEGAIQVAVAAVVARK